MVEYKLSRSTEKRNQGYKTHLYVVILIILF